MNKIVKVISLVLITMCAISVVSCGTNKEKKSDLNIATPVKEDSLKVEEDTVEPSYEGMSRSLLTGEWIDEDVAKQRPLACMIANTKIVDPQSNIGEAKILYEVPVEGGITRTMALFEDYTKFDKIGSIRSCRFYFVHYAMEYDAIYAHFGQSHYADELLNRSDVNNISGLNGSDFKYAFFRTGDIGAPHNAFINGQGIMECAQAKGYNLNISEDLNSHFQFALEDEEQNLESGTTATLVKTRYPVSNTYFKYNDKEKTYDRYQFGRAHMDAVTGKQLTFKNVILEYTNITYMPDQYSLNITTTGSGEGVYLTNGKSEPITWEKKGDFDVTHYYDASGEEISLNVGKTNICIISNSDKSDVTIE